MRTRLTAMLLCIVALSVALPQGAWARADAIWARNAVTSPLTLDGVLNEVAWTKAESLNVRYGVDLGIPGSGWKIEAGLAVPNDTMKATVKFLVKGDYLWLGVTVKDRFVGGSTNWERWDGWLMALKDHLSVDAPKPSNEYFYSWWADGTGQADPQPQGQLPNFRGRWGSDPAGAPRTAEQIANWDAVTIVHGISNSDAVFDQGYTFEMRMKMSVMGYDVIRSEGDVVEWSTAIYDCDGFWPLNGAYFASNRVWIQSPWGRDAWYGEMRIWTRPDISIFTPTAQLPSIDPEVYVLNGVDYASPTLDGNLSEPVWNAAFPSFDIRYGDDLLRQTYGIPGKWRAGQFQPEVNGGQAGVLDPGDATVKMFFKGTKLYLGFDVRDQLVQYHTNFDRWDGFIVTPNDRVVRNLDNALQGRRLTFQVGPDGEAIPQDYLLTMVQAGQAQIAMNLKSGTTVDTLGMDIDAGWTAELEIELTALGYPADLGDRVLFIGVNLLDGDSFLNPSMSYGTRAWWFRQYEGECCPCWGYLDPNLTNAVDSDGSSGMADLLRNYPNPGVRTTIEYSLAQPGFVTMDVFDVAGRLVEHRSLGSRPAGPAQTEFDGAELPGGVYLYRLQVSDPGTREIRDTQQGRMIIVN